MSNYDLVVVGSGPGGYVAAARAGALGLKTAVVEKDAALGGTCLHRGCIPTKALLHAADLYTEIKDASKVGISVEGVKIDWKKVQAYKDRIINTNAGGVQHLMKNRKVEIIKGFGRIKDVNTIEVETSENKSQTLTTKHVLLAVGSTPRPLPFAPFGGRILSSDEILSIDQIPGSLVVIGGGVIGIEFASLFARLGTEVTVVEALPRILAPADADCSKELAYQLEQQGAKLHVNAKVSSIESKKTYAQTTFTTASGESVVLKSEYVLVAIGRAPLTEQIGLDKLQIKATKGYIDVNAYLQTSTPSIYAIGDCVNTPWLAHVASFEGMIAVEHMAGKNPPPFNYEQTPSCVYSYPEVAWCGLTQEEAEKRGLKVKVTKFDFIRNGKAAILGQKRGFIKLLTDPQYGEIIGAHIIGPHATDLIAELAFAMQQEATVEDLAYTMHAHPTLYESIFEAASMAIGRAVHG